MYDDNDDNSYKVGDDDYDDSDDYYYDNDDEEDEGDKERCISFSGLITSYIDTWIISILLIFFNANTEILNDKFLAMFILMFM